MIKTAMILCAGRGERMRPLTDACPKVLLDFRGEPLLAHHLHACHKAGIQKIVINHAHLGQMIEDTIGDGSRFGVEVQYSPEGIGGLETGGGIFQALPLLGEAPFIVINGDVWSELDLKSLSISPNDLAHLVFVPNPDFHPTGDYALKNGRVTREGSPKYCFSGISVMRREFFQKCEAGFFPLRTPLNSAIDQHKVSGELFAGAWINFNTLDTYQRAQGDFHESTIDS